MAEPTSALSFYDLLTRIAREVGIAYYGSDGQQRAMIPVDVDKLDLCKEIVNDGIKMFIADAPVRGWRWMRRIMEVTFIGPRITGVADADTDATHLVDLTLTNTYKTEDALKDWYAYILTGTGEGSYAQITAYDEDTGSCTVADWLDEDTGESGIDPEEDSTFCIIPSAATGGDTSRYLLAENFGGGEDGPVHYAAGSGHATPIEWRSESQIRAIRAVSVNNGHPRRVAIRPYEPTGNALSATRRWELVVDSWPMDTSTIEFPYTLFFDQLRLEAGIATNGAAGAISNSSLANIYPDGFFDDWRITVIDSDGKGNTAIITSYVGADGEFFVDDWLYSDGTAAPINPASGSAYYLEPVANLHPAGFKFDQAILAACLAQAELMTEDIVSDFVNKYVQKDLMVAHQIDTRSAPRKLGSMNTLRREQRPRHRGEVTYN